MEVNNILKSIENLKNKFNCSNCKASCNVSYRIKLCGHILCQQCILEIKKCTKCDTVFGPDDVFVDHALPTISNAIDNIATKLQNNDTKEPNPATSSCEVQQSEQNEFNHILDSVCTNDRLTDCDCWNHIELKDKTNATEHVDKKNAQGETKLLIACKKGNETKVKELLEAGASVNAQDYAGWIPLHEAVLKSNKTIVEMLIEKGSVVNAPGFNYDTPLNKAVITKNIEIAQILVKNGANVYSKNYDGISPWDLADADMKFALNDVKCKTLVIQIPIKLNNLNIFFLGEINAELKNDVFKFNKMFTVNEMNELNEHVTHVICGSSLKVVKPSFELFLAIVYCKPVITSEWLHTCVTLRTVVDYKEYFIIGTKNFEYDVIHRTQINKYKLNPKLFSGCHIYLIKGCEKYHLFDTGIILNSSQMGRLITVGGGTLLKREPLPHAINQTYEPWHAADSDSLKNCTHYMLYNPDNEPALRYNMKELKHMPYQWIFECILKYQLVVPEALIRKQSPEKTNV